MDGQQINQRDNDGMVNLTQMAQVNNVLVGDWTRLDTTQEYILAVSEDMQICITETLTTSNNTLQNGGGSWGHPLVAIAFAQWISPKFHVWCNKHIKTLLETGSTSIPALQNRIKDLEFELQERDEMIDCFALIESQNEKLMEDNLALQRELEEERSRKLKVIDENPSMMEDVELGLIHWKNKDREINKDAYDRIVRKSGRKIAILLVKNSNDLFYFSFYNAAGDRIFSYFCSVLELGCINQIKAYVDKHYGWAKVQTVQS